MSKRLSRQMLKALAQRVNEGNEVSETTIKETFQTVALLSPDKDRINLDFGLYYRATEQHEKAIIAFEKDLKSHPHDTETYRQLSDCQLGLYRWKDALKSYHAILKLEPGSRYACNIQKIKGHALAQKGYALSDSYARNASFLLEKHDKQPRPEPIQDLLKIFEDSYKLHPLRSTEIYIWNLRNLYENLTREIETPEPTEPTEP